ncbi:MAG: hypothetical protein ABJB11_11805 [Ferruginibacter sp.]
MIDYEGPQAARIFNAPVYQTPQKIASHLPDFRNVLNWMPAIIPGKDGRYQTSFYSSDLPGKYIIEVQGITANGTPLTSNTFFEVKAKKSEKK